MSKGILSSKVVTLFPLHFFVSPHIQDKKSYTKSVTQKALHFFRYTLFNGRKHCMLTSGNRISMSLCPMLMNQMESKTETSSRIQ